MNELHNLHTIREEKVRELFEDNSTLTHLRRRPRPILRTLKNGKISEKFTKCAKKQDDSLSPLPTKKILYTHEPFSGRIIVQNHTNRREFNTNYQ